VFNPWWGDLKLLGEHFVVLPGGGIQAKKTDAAMHLMDQGVMWNALQAYRQSAFRFIAAEKNVVYAYGQASDQSKLRQNAHIFSVSR